MFMELKNILEPAAIARLREIAGRAHFIDGRISNPHNQTKNNLQVDYESGEFKESMKIVGDALWNREEFRNYTFPKRMAPPLLCRYDVGMNYGAHSDGAFMTMNPTPLRSDISSTIFINDPSTYDGGELVIHLGSKSIPVKGEPGTAIIYPSTTLHEVTPVTRGQRLVAITFIESQIKDTMQRELLYTLNEIAAREGLKMDWRNRVQLDHVRQALLRMWGG